jgi:hypothetical protein
MTMGASRGFHWASPSSCAELGNTGVSPAYAESQPRVEPKPAGRVLRTPSISPSRRQQSNAGQMKAQVSCPLVEEVWRVEDAPDEGWQRRQVRRGRTLRCSSPVGRTNVARGAASEASKPLVTGLFNSRSRRPAGRTNSHGVPVERRTKTIHAANRFRSSSGRDAVEVGLFPAAEAAGNVRAPYGRFRMPLAQVRKFGPHPCLAGMGRQWYVRDGASGAWCVGDAPCDAARIGGRVIQGRRGRPGRGSASASGR